MITQLLTQRLKAFVGDFVPEEHIRKYLEYGTCLWVEKNGEIVAYVQFNIKGKTAHITFLKIKQGYNSYKVMHYFIREGKRKYTYLEGMEFERQTRGDMKRRKYKI